jgi:predicted PolB exonuclease-like 3'-5' exonuclease
MSEIAYLVIDIETVPDEGLIRATRYPDQEFESADGATKQYQLELLERSGGKSDFIPATYQLPVSLAYAALDDHFRIVKLGTLDRPEFRPVAILETFWKIWSKHQPCVVTFNGKGFDLPVLELGAFRYGIQAPAWFKHFGPLNTQPRYRFNLERHFDLQEFFGNFGAIPVTGGLNLCATLLGKPGKMDTKGSMVSELWAAGEALRIDDYCLCDVLDTYFVFLRSRVMLGQMDLVQERALVDAAKEQLEIMAPMYPGIEDYLARFGMWEHPGSGAGWFKSLADN